MSIAPETTGLGISRFFTEKGKSPYDDIHWEKRDALIENFKDGTIAFAQSGVEFPASWSQNAVNIVSQKYFRGQLGTPERESSLKQLIDRVVKTIVDWGTQFGYFISDEETAVFEDELRHILVT